MSSDAISKPLQPVLSPAVDATTTCGVEYFHIYTDEEINASHEATVDYLQSSRQAWEFKPHSIVLIDNYNPTVHTLTPDMVFAHLENKGELPDFWAFEGDMVDNAQILLSKVTSPKLKRNYERYIEKHGKYPCSLLTASWYLTRLGYLDHETTIRPLGEESYSPPDLIINILSESYSGVESRCLELIEKSEFAAAAEAIHAVFIPIVSNNKTTL